jgi:hypothetical protein
VRGDPIDLNDSDRRIQDNTVVPYGENIELPPAWAAVKRRYVKVDGKWVPRT